MSPLSVRLGRWYATWRLRRGLDGVFVEGLHHLREALAQGPVVVAANHVAWWDGLVMFAVDDAVGASSRVIVDAESLVRLPFLYALGAIGVDRSAPAAARQGMRAATAWLEGPERAVWVFPQGRERPANLRPLGLQRGVELLARGATVVPVSLTYGFRDRPEPCAVVVIGAPLAGGAQLTARLERALVDGLDSADRWLDAGAGDLGPLVPAPGKRAEDGLATRVLGWIAQRVWRQRRMERAHV